MHIMQKDGDNEVKVTTTPESESEKWKVIVKVILNHPGKSTKSSDQLSQESLRVKIVPNGCDCHQTPPVQKFVFVFVLLVIVITPHRTFN